MKIIGWRARGSPFKVFVLRQSKKDRAPRAPYVHTNDLCNHALGLDRLDETTPSHIYYNRGFISLEFFIKSCVIQVRFS